MHNQRGCIPSDVRARERRLTTLQQNVRRSIAVFNCLMVLGVFVTGGCGSKRAEAVRFCRLLTQKQSALASINAREAPLVVAIARWGGTISFMGGNGVSTDVARAKGFAQQVEETRAQLASVREVIEAETLNDPFNQTVRNSIVNTLKRREQFLEVTKGLQETSAAGFPHVGAYQHPMSIEELNQKLQTYAQPDENVANSIREIRTKYDIADAEIS